MKLPLPGPSEVIALIGSLRDAVGAALDLVPRITVVVGQAEVLLARVELLVSSIEATNRGAEEAVERVEATQRRAEDAVAGAQRIANRVDPMISVYEPVLRTLAPMLRRLADTTSESEIDAAVAMVDHLPRLVAHVDDDVLPLLATLQRVGPDIHELLEVMQDVRQVITGLPGAGFLRRRGDDELPSEQP